MQPGTTIGSYQILRKLGEGGMGAVYEATHALLGRRAAVKVLLPMYSQNADIVNRFFNEARAATAVADPGIVQIFDFGHHEGAAYIVMEFLEGESLEARLRRVGRLAVVDAGRICRQVAMALAAAHRRGIVHRDLKPDNVFLVPDLEVVGGERAKVLDFGIAKLVGDDQARSATRTGSVIGTPEYMSPEQCRGANTVQIDHRADVYALGCILFTLVTGTTPFRGEGAGDLIIAHVTTPPPAPSTLVPDLPPDVDAVVLRCLAKKPADRFQSMLEVAQALGQGAVAGPVSTEVRAPTGAFAMHPTPPPSSAFGTAPGAATITGAAAEIVPARPTKRGRLVFAGALAAIAIAGVSIAIATSGGSDDTDAPTQHVQPAASPRVSSEPARPQPPEPVAPIVPIVAGSNAAPPTTVEPPPPAGSGSATTAVAGTGSGSASDSAKPPSPIRRPTPPSSTVRAKPKATKTCRPDDLFCVQ
jgi:serine/threonine-protein kinase